MFNRNLAVRGSVICFRMVFYLYANNILVIQHQKNTCQQTLSREMLDLIWPNDWRSTNQSSMKFSPWNIKILWKQLSGETFPLDLLENIGHWLSWGNWSKIFDFHALWNTSRWIELSDPIEVHHFCLCQNVNGNIFCKILSLS